MRIRRNPFAETGGANQFLSRVEDQSQGVTDLPGVDHIGDLTPFQNQVLDAAMQKRAEKKEEARNGNQSATGGRTRNSRADNSGQSDMSREETVRYINTNENPDYESN